MLQSLAVQTDQLLFFGRQDRQETRTCCCKRMLLRTDRTYVLDTDIYGKRTPEYDTFYQTAMIQQTGIFMYWDRNIWHEGFGGLHIMKR